MLRQNVLSPNGNRSCDGLYLQNRQTLNLINYLLGLKLHITDIYLEELAKVAGIALKPKRLILLLSPFFNIIKTSDQ